MAAQSSEKPSQMSDRALSDFLRDHPADSHGGPHPTTDPHYDHSRNSVSSTSRLTDNVTDPVQFSTAIPADVTTMPGYDRPTSGSTSFHGPADTHLHHDQLPLADDEGQLSRMDIRSSAVRILYTYVWPNGEKGIKLDQEIQDDINHAITEEHRDDPQVFEAAHRAVFEKLERYAFPGFLRARALGNLAPTTLMLYSIAGFVAIFAAFWAAFVLIFLNHTRLNRCWVCFIP